MVFNGWAVSLNGVLTPFSCVSQEDWDDLDCVATNQVIGNLDGTPEGLDLPDRRTEDVTYFQRDGVKPFKDWYMPRFIPLRGTVGPPPDDDTCTAGNCSHVRSQVQTLAQAWKRQPNTELVVFSDCYQPDFTDGINVYPDGTFDVDTDGWTGVDGATVARVTTPVHTGAGALRVTWGTDPVPYNDPTSTGQAALGATLSGLTPGDKYQVSAWLYAAAGEPMPVLGCKDTTGDGIVWSDPVIADDTWHKTTVDYFVPDSGELVPFVVNGEATTSGDLAYVDDVEATQYTNVDRTVNGPFGIVGRPRQFKGKWLDRAEQIYEFTALFMGVDQRMYVLDECGTPGYTQCADIEPGSQLFSVCFEDGTGDYAGEKVVCFGGAGFCFTNSVETGASVDPTTVAVSGTEQVYPTITLYPGLSSPTVENITTGEWVGFDGDILELPVTINTEEGTAFDSEGQSLTHLLRGSLFLSMFPGNYQWRLLSAGDDVDDPGYATLCFRPTVVTG